MARWGFVSDALIRAYNRTAISEPIAASISKIYSNEKIQAFVDDSHGIIIRQQQSELTLDEMLQHNMQTWESLLNAVGGKLEINKCKYLKFGENNIQPPNSTGPSDITRTITITDHETNGDIPLSEIQTSTPYKLLGVHIAFDGNQKQQALALLEKCEKLAIAFQRCHLSSDDTLQGYRSIFLPGAQYGLSATSLSPKQTSHSQRIITNTVLPKLG
jgi:hypothetical protein